MFVIVRTLFMVLPTKDVARELEEGERKKKPNCFALGPVFDNFARRTYYISCGELLFSSLWVYCRPGEGGVTVNFL